MLLDVSKREDIFGSNDLDLLVGKGGWVFMPFIDPRMDDGWQRARERGLATVQISCTRRQSPYLRGRPKQSDVQRESRVVFDAVWFAVQRIMDSSLVIEVDRANNRQIHHYVLPCANIKPHLHIDHLPEVLEKIKELGARVEKTGRFQEL